VIGLGVYDRAAFDGLLVAGAAELAAAG